jgi:hypothetical protein
MGTTGGARSNGSIRIVRRELPSLPESGSVVRPSPKKSASFGFSLSPEILAIRNGSVGQLEKIFSTYFPDPFDETSPNHEFARSLTSTVVSSLASRPMLSHGLTAVDYESMRINILRLAMGADRRNPKNRSDGWKLVYGGTVLAFHIAVDHLSIALYNGAAEEDFSALLDISCVPGDPVGVSYVRDPDEGMTPALEKMLRLAAWALLAEPGILHALEVI